MLSAFFFLNYMTLCRITEKLDIYHLLESQKCSQIFTKKHVYIWFFWRPLVPGYNGIIYYTYYSIWHIGYNKTCIFIWSERMYLNLLNLLASTTESLPHCYLRLQRWHLSPALNRKLKNITWKIFWSHQMNLWMSA